MAAAAVSRYPLGVKYRCLDRVRLLSQLKRLVADMFRLDILTPDDIADDAPFVGGSLDLDSFDRLELALCVEETFGIAMRGDEESRIARGSIAGLADVIQAHMQAARLTAAGSVAARTAGAPAALRYAQGAPA